MAEKMVLGIVFGASVELDEPLTENQYRFLAHAAMHGAHPAASNCHVTVFEHPSARMWEAILADYGAENTADLIGALTPGYPTAIVEADMEADAVRPPRLN